MGWKANVVQLYKKYRSEAIVGLLVFLFLILRDVVR
jgi:hypothetical protein